MADVYADYTDIQAAIIAILNANEPGVFSTSVDTGESADSRYSNDMITNARRAAAYRILDAIGSNPSHPYWGSLATKVTVAHGDPIPACFGEIGVPEILALGEPYSRNIGGSLGSVTNGYPTAAFADVGLFVTADIGRVLTVLDGATTVLTGTILSWVEALGQTEVTVDANATDSVSDCNATVTSPAETIDDWVTGIAASPDEVESYRANKHNMYSNPLGDLTEQHDAGATTLGVYHPLMGRYSTANGYIKFTGYQCRIPMIQQPANLAAAETMADTKIPIALLGTCVRLALAILYKEGDNLARLAAIYSLQGENDLVAIRGGAIRSAPIDVARAVQFGQRYNG